MIHVRHGLALQTGQCRSTPAAPPRIRFAVEHTSLGAILVASSTKGIASILLGDDPDELVPRLQDRHEGASCRRGPLSRSSRVVGFVDAPGRELNLPLDVRGTAFQRRVWQKLQEIPIGRKRHLRRSRWTDRVAEGGGVAGACAANNLAVAIPCHRVVRTDGSLSGYAWGIERKRVLLDREAQLR